MYEDGKKYIMVGALGAVLGAAVVWGVCGSVRDNGGAADDAGRELDRAAIEQRRAIGSIERIEHGLDRSAERIGSLAGEVGRGREAAAGITGRVGAAQERITKCERIAHESEQRIAVCRGICENIRKKAPTH